MKNPEKNRNKPMTLVLLYWPREIQTTYEKKTKPFPGPDSNEKTDKHGNFSFLGNFFAKPPPQENCEKSPDEP